MEKLKVKTLLKISIIIMTIIALLSVCKFDIINSFLSMISLSTLVFAYAIFTAEEYEDND